MSRDTTHVNFVGFECTVYNSVRARSIVHGSLGSSTSTSNINLIFSSWIQPRSPIINRSARSRWIGKQNVSIWHHRFSFDGFLRLFGRLRFRFLFLLPLRLHICPLLLQPCLHRQTERLVRLAQGLIEWLVVADGALGFELVVA